MATNKVNLGILFGENIEGGVNKLNLSARVDVDSSNDWGEKNETTYTREQISAWRLVPVFLVVFLVFLLLSARAFKLQMIDGASFLDASEGNYVQVRVDHAPRGVVFDRNGKVLARNTPGFRVAVRKIDLPKDWQKSLTEVAALLNEDAKTFIAKIETAKTDSVTLVSEVNNDHIIALKAKQDSFPWLDIEIDPKREYPYGEILAPLIGYTGEVSPENLKKSGSTPYSPGDQVGRAGIEASFEQNLRGANGYKLVKVDSSGKEEGTLLSTKPQAGGDVTLSIDIDLQKFLYENLKAVLEKETSATGASAVVSDPFNGEILALVSLPSYDNNIFSKPLSQEQYNNLINSGKHPLLNRPIGSSFPPGSTFKLLTAVAGLESGAIEANTRILDTGFVQLGEQVFNNWLWLERRGTDGEINVARALQRSNDTFFFKLGQKVGVNTLSTWAKAFGYGAKTGIELPAETAGLVPTPEWKKATFKQIWFPGETLNMAIGQGYMLSSPLQVNNMTAVFANGGKLFQSTIVRRPSPKILADNLIKPETLSVLRDGLYKNTIEDGGTSYLFNNFKIKLGGKTGTAESGIEAPHAWYTAYAPLENPKIVITVMVENSGHGSEVSAPVVKKVLDWYFK